MKASFRLLAALVACALLAACPSSKPPALEPDGSGFPLESVTPPVEGGDPRVLQQVEALGDSVYLDALGVFVSFDKRRTWKELNAQALGSIQKWVFVTPTAGIAHTGKHGLAYIELDKDVIYYLNNEPAWSAWGLRGDGTLFTVRTTGDGTDRVWLGRRRDFTQDAPWPEVELPRLPFSHRTYQPSVHFGANGDIYVASYYGLQVSSDDGQTWRQLPVVPGEQGSLSWSGIGLFVTRAGTLFARESSTTFVSRDGGASWAPAPFPGGGLTHRSSMMTMEEPVPGELHFRDIAYRSTDEGRTYQQVFTLKRYGADRSPDALFYRGGEYYVHLKLLSNFVSAAPDESLTILNPPRMAHLTPGNLSRAFPLSGGRFAGLWNEWLITYTPGDIGWKAERFFNGARYLEKLRDGRLVLAQNLGLSFSRDEGATWSAPVPVSKAFTNSVRVKKVVEAPGRLFLSGVDKSDCDKRPLMESRDDGASWQPVKVELVLDPKQTPVTSYEPELTTSDLQGQLLGYASNLFNCSETATFTAHSVNQGATWVGTKDRLPLAATSRDNLLAIDDQGREEAIMFWDRAQGEWQSFGPPQAGGVTLPDLFVSYPFIHVDGSDHVYFTDSLRVYRSAKPVP